MDGLSFTILFIFLFIVFVILILFLLWNKNNTTIAVIQQLTIPNFQGSETLLQSYTSNKLIIYDTVTPTDISRAITNAYNRGAKKMILSVTSTALEVQEIQDKIKSLEGSVTFIANASTVESIRTSLPNVYYVLTPDTTLIYKSLYGFHAPLESVQNVFISAGIDDYILQAKEIATSLGFYIIDGTNYQDFTSEQLSKISSSEAVFISAFSMYHEFIISQIPEDYAGMINYVNIGPSSTLTYPSSADVHCIYPGSSVVIPEESEWNKSVRGATSLCHPLLMGLPLFVSQYDWNIFVKGQILSLGSSNPLTTIIWTSVS